ncbi:MAG: glycosyltransferase family 9 protein [Ginsengibacter sp.]
MYNRLKSWKKKHLPKRILAIRLHAMGDVIITLPYLQHLRNNLPTYIRLDFLTLSEFETIPKNIHLFHKVYAIKGGRVFKKQLWFAFLLLPRLFLNRYDIVIDLNDAFLSRLIRRCLMAKAWSTFDKISHIPAGERTRQTIESVGLGKIYADTNLKIKDRFRTERLLKENGWDGYSNLVVLNPAGAFETRNWPLSNYLEFAKLWLHEFPLTQFLVMGIEAILPKANYLKSELYDRLINLANKTTPAEAFVIVQQVSLVVSEDSGLMHMAWVSGIPTLALFGSTKSFWAQPLGNHTIFLSSSDLECGDCMLEICKYGDTHCLTRYSPKMVFEKAASLIKRCNSLKLRPNFLQKLFRFPIF